MTELERVVGVERTAPPALLKRLRDIEPRAELVYMGGGTWYLGRSAPTEALQEAGWARTRAVNRQTAENKLDESAKRMHRMGRMQQAGFQFTAQYTGDPDGRIVHELYEADRLWKLAANWYRYDEMCNGADRAEQAQARRDLTDPYRAKDAWDYWRKRTHAVSTRRVS